MGCRASYPGDAPCPQRMSGEHQWAVPEVVGVPPTPSDRERVRRIVAELQAQQRTQGAGPVMLDGLAAGAVLNVLIGKTPPLSPDGKEDP